jgi:hypothetical protein
LVGPRIQDLVKSLIRVQFDAAAEQQILQLTDDFLDKVVNKRCACRNTGVARLWMCKTCKVSFGQAMEYRWFRSGTALAQETNHVSRPPSANGGGGGGSSGIKRKASIIWVVLVHEKNDKKPNTGSA